jgi:hypothetical protein
MKPFLILPLWCIWAQMVNGQTLKSRNESGIFYFALGTHKIFYTQSDIHLIGKGNPSFDLTLKNVKAKDDFFLKGNGGAPQYDYKLGYYFTKKKFGIEFNFNHVKYFVRKDQVVKTTGFINEQKVDNDAPVTTYVQNFEHSDGANYLLLNFVKWENLPHKPGRDPLVLQLKAGAGPVVPKTNSTILNNQWDDHYQIAGFVLALETGLRYHFHKNFFIEPSFKGAYADYRKFLIADGYGSQRWFSAQFILAAGVQFGL